MPKKELKDVNRDKSFRYRSGNKLSRRILYHVGKVPKLRKTTLVSMNILL